MSTLEVYLLIARNYIQSFMLNVFDAIVDFHVIVLVVACLAVICGIFFIPKRKIKV